MTCGETNSVQKSKVRMSNTKQERKQGSLKKNLGVGSGAMEEKAS